MSWSARGDREAAHCKGGIASPRSAVRGAARVVRPSNENTSGDLARFPGARGRAPSPNCTRIAGWRCFQGEFVPYPTQG
jgi:hypothetical protein